MQSNLPQDLGIRLVNGKSFSQQIGPIPHRELRKNIIVTHPCT